MSDAPAVRGAHAPAGVAEARAALVEWVDAAGERGRTFLQARLRRAAPGIYEIRNVRDAHRALASLSTVSRDPYAAREIAQTTNQGEHRPLKTAPSLRQGWALVELDERGLWTALDYLYPACAMHWYAGREGTLRVTHWRETAGRQSGIYSPVGLLTETALRDTARACCGDVVCLRRVAWGVDAENPVPLPDELDGEMRAEGGDALVPCPEACSVFISFARKVLTLERSRREELAGLGPMSGAEVEQIRAIVARAATGTAEPVREGEFDEPANLRRVRYLAARLRRAAVDPVEESLPCEGCPRPVRCAGCPLT